MDGRPGSAPLTRSLVVDGPPLAAVIVAFTAVEAVSWGAGQPLLGLAITAVGLCAAVIADFRAWAARTGRPREEILWPARDFPRHRISG